MDQAEGLRQLAKAGAFEQMGLPAVFDRSPKIDKTKLWDAFKYRMAVENPRVFDAMNEFETAAHHIRPANDIDFANVRATLQGDSHD